MGLRGHGICESLRINRLFIVILINNILTFKKRYVILYSYTGGNTNE